MNITEIRCHRLTAPLHTPFVTALRRTEHLETTVVEVVDDDGLQRVRRGAAGLAGHRRVAGRGRGLPERAAGRRRPRPRRSTTSTTWRASSRDAVVGNFGAKAAMDVALHDLAARRAGVTLAAFLGARDRRAAGRRPT